ncbi:MFS transporter [Streptomyces tubbatahanensis]|uniref:MFS transporter n=1 Tax=Streptomyces tubbatahanensis TaxID=2923272 RepID=A0ABY3Y1W3_9ACTN|nr:MFS transporter [Streptomyces tubbatahanensis]UNT00572.1 MFS transporter [Streptomyces tubbatahanensis]
MPTSPSPAPPRGAAAARGGDRPPRLRARWAILAADFMVLGLNYADRAAIGVAAPYIISEFGFSETAFGWILSIFALSYAPFGFLGGWAADRFGPRKAMGWAALAWSVFTAATAAGAGLVSFLVIRILFGAAEGPQATVTAKLMNTWFPKRELGTAVGVANAATPLGGAVGTPIVVAVIEATDGNWRVPFVIFGVIGVLFTVGWFAVVRDTPERHPWVRPAELREIRGAETGKEAEDGTAAAGEASGTGDGHAERAWAALPGMWHYVARPVIWATALAYFGYAWILNVFLTWFPTYLVSERGIDLDQLAVAGAIPWIGGCVGMIAGGIATDWLVRRLGAAATVRRWTIVVCLILTALLFGCIALVGSAGEAVALMAVIVFLLYFTGAQYWTVVAEEVPGPRYGSVAGVVQFIAGCAGFLAPLVTGAVVEHARSWTTAFAIAVVITVTGALLLAVAGRARTVRGSAR